jgi:RNase H-like domain found in reverse transcriptase
LTEFLKGSKSGSAAVDWSPEREAVFVAAKEKVAAATMLAHPVAGAELALAVDASDLHVGAVLQQREGPTAIGGRWDFSRKNWSRPKQDIQRSIENYMPALPP